MSRFLIESKENKLVKHVRKLVSSRKYRHECREFVCEGQVMTSEALSRGYDMTEIIATEEALSHISLSGAIKINIVPEALYRYISPQENPQGVMFTSKMPDIKKGLTERSYILLDNISDTGNLGTIIRCADAFSAGGIILYGSCADVYNPKTVRASMGSIFRVDFFHMEISEVKETGLKIYAAVTNGENFLTKNLSCGIVVIGNEACGVSEELLGISERITIRMTGGAESLNAAVSAGIIMHHMQAERRRNS